MNNYTIWGLFGPATWPWWLTALALGALARGAAGRRWARRFCGASVIVFLLFAVLPTGYWLAEPLEQRFRRPALPGRAIRHIVVLTGAERLAVSARSGRPELNGGAERVVESARLARAIPTATLWIVGGVRDRRSPRSDAEWTAATWRELGIAPARISIVDGTLDTCANAAGLAARRPRGTILLVTSALHMPRAVACFRAAGVATIVPYPVDYQNESVDGIGDLLSANLLGNLQRTDSALHEWIGLVVYRARNRTRDLFPSYARAVSLRFRSGIARPPIAWRGSRSMPGPSQTDRRCPPPSRRYRASCPGRSPWER